MKSLLLPSPRRALIFCAMGAISGLGLAGFGLFTAKGTTSHAIPPEAAAMVNQRPILQSDFRNQVETEFALPFAQASAAQKRKVLDDMIREELFVQRALELDMPGTDPDTRTALVASVEQQIGAEITAAPPNLTALKRYYDSHVKDYESEGVMMAHDLVPTRAGAGIDPAAAQPEAPLSEIERRYGLKDSGKLGPEEFYFAARIHLGDALFAVAKRLKSGESALVKAADGPHLLLMIKNTPPQARRFDEVQDAVRTDSIKSARAAAEAAELKYLHGQAEILIQPEYR